MHARAVCLIPILLGIAMLMLCTFCAPGIALQDQQASDHPIRVLFDEAYGERNTISWERALALSPDHPEWFFFGELAKMLISEFTLDRGVEPLTAATLKDFDAVVISSPTSAFTVEEIGALRDFVMRGGGLLVAQDSGPLPSEGGNQLAEAFGLRFHSGVLRSQYGDWDPESFRVGVAQSGHPVVQGVDEFQMNWGCSIEHTEEVDVLLQSDEHTWQDINGDKRRDSDEPGGPLTVAVAQRVGEGRIVFIADNAFQDAIWDPNRTLFVNGVKWLVGTTILADEGSAHGGLPSSSPLACCECESAAPGITFYPDRTEIRPGETITWMIEVHGMQLPVTIVPDFDNDGIAEQPIHLRECLSSISTTYAEANVYAPYFAYEDPRSGVEIIVHSRSIVGVLPELEGRSGIGLRLPTPDNPTGDYIKGMHVFTVDQTLFDSPSGREFARSELERIAGLGVNLVVFNSTWFVRDAESSNIEPHYGAVWPWHWQNTLTIANLIDLVDWTHELGMRAGFRFLNTPAENYDSTGNFARNPQSAVLHARLQAEKHGFYASLAERLCVEFYDLGGEDNLMTKAYWGAQVADAVREHFTGYVTISPTSTDGTLYQCPFISKLGVLGQTEYLGQSLVDDGITDVDTITEVVVTHFRNGLEQFLLEKQTVGLIMELGANIRDLGIRNASNLAEALLASLSGLADSNSPITGTIWWIWNIRREQLEPHAVKDTRVETLIGEYYRNILPDRITVNFSVEEPRPVSCSRQVDAFDLIVPEFEIWQSGSSMSVLPCGAGFEDGSRCLRLSLIPDDSAANPRYGFIWRELEGAQDWRSFEGLTLWLKSSAGNWGVEVNLVDADGDRFNTRITAVPWFDDWHRIWIPFSSLIQPSWARNDGDLQLDLSRIVRWGIGVVYNNHGPQSVYVDDICLFE